MINSLGCGDLSPLSNVSELLGKSGDKSPHSKELSYPRAIHIRGEAQHEDWGYLEPDIIVARNKHFIHSFVVF